VLSRVHPTRLHQESPSSSEIIMVSNFLVGATRRSCRDHHGLQLPGLQLGYIATKKNHSDRLCRNRPIFL
jgi:hypothetical protein